MNDPRSSGGSFGKAQRLHFPTTSPQVGGWVLLQKGLEPGAALSVAVYVCIDLLACFAAGHTIEGRGLFAVVVVPSLF